MGNISRVIQQIPNLITTGIVVGCIVALAALGLSLIFSIQHFVNVAHGEYMTVAAYATLFFSSLGVNMVLSAAMGILVCIAVVLLVYILVFKRMRNVPSVSLVITSIGVGFILRYGIAAIWGSQIIRYPIKVSSGIDLGWIRTTPEEIIIVVVTIIEMIGLYLVLKKTRLGIEMRAVADVPDLARVSGISRDRVILWTWVIAAILAASGGIGVAMYSFLTPLLGWQMLLVAFSAAILGGIGSPQGAVIGGLIMGITQELSTLIIPVNYKLAVAFFMIFLVLLLRPSGIFGKVTRI